MSALTEQVAREHRAQEVLSRLSDREGRHLYVGCTCGVGPLSALSHAAHVATVTEQAVRANVAAEIREQADTFMRVTLATYDDLAVKAYLDAYRIAEGRQP